MNNKSNLKRNLLICLFAGSSLLYTMPLHAATGVVANNALPDFDKVMSGTLADNPVISNNGLTMDVTQTSHNAVIKWHSFDVGGSATVNFWGPDKHNTLNYVNSGAASQIYGTINANNNGNIFIINPAGVQIGNSAQINVGSLYVSNKNLDNVDWNTVVNDNTNLNEFLKGYKNTDAELMSLGNINATKVTFEGDGRIVIDSERIKNAAGDAVNNNFEVHTNDAGNVLIGYEAYNTGENKGTYNGKDKEFNNVYLNGSTTASNVKGYMWVEDVEQLQAINTNLDGNYALRNAIDATGTSGWNEGDQDGTYEGFNPIGTEEKAFTGKLDGLGNNIFGLTIDRSDEDGANNAGLFGVVKDAYITNFNFVGGSITGKDNVGSLAGTASGNTVINNVVNSAAVNGQNHVGGLVGYADGGTYTGLINTGKVTGSQEDIGGLIGSLNVGVLNGSSYNLGDISSGGYDVGGLVGHAINSTIGDETGAHIVYNHMDVSGLYNVGGIVGSMEGSEIYHAENTGEVAALGYITDNYIFHSAYETDDGYNDHDINGNAQEGGGYAVHQVNAANAGGIAGLASGSSINHVQNSGNVKSNTARGQEGDYTFTYYTGGNVGGIAGKAVNTGIDDAINRENEVFGAHNVGGIAGYFGSTDNNAHYITKADNDNGEIMSTGAVHGDTDKNGKVNFITEIIRGESGYASEEFIIGNIGGVAGYMFGDNVYLNGTSNTGNIHSMYIDVNRQDSGSVDAISINKAANAGGIVGKIDRGSTKTLDDIKDDKNKAADATAPAVYNSYNTGKVEGYTGVGGIAGMMYNGEVAFSYNLGDISTTREGTVGTASINALNMGGIVGDTTEISGADVLLYDVYNKGEIGDSEFHYFGRHVGGIVGRLNGTVEKAYNNGAIYNGYNVVGGIAGYMYDGSINNAFNTGNITVYNQNDATSQVGGIVGAADGRFGITINNVYNVGTLRSFTAQGYGDNSLGGILGTATQSGSINIDNAYTTGNLYAGVTDAGGSVTEDLVGGEIYGSGYTAKVGSIYGSTEYNATVKVGAHTYYITPAADDNGKTLFTDLSGLEFKDNGSLKYDFANNNAKQTVKYDNIGKYDFKFGNSSGGEGIDRPKTANGNLELNSDWRIYDGGTPILNAFIPNLEEYFGGNAQNMDGIESIQYGTAYDPLLTIITANKDLQYDWQELGINNSGSMAVYGAGVTFDNFLATGGTGFFSGLLYSDGKMNINSTGDVNLGSAADIYGSAVNITAEGTVQINGSVTATGLDAAEGADPNENGSISITAGNVIMAGTLEAAQKGHSVAVPGIKDTADKFDNADLKADMHAVMDDFGSRFAYETEASEINGNININTDGDVEITYGNVEKGLLTTAGDLTVNAGGDVYMDSDLHIGGDILLNSSGAGSEIVLDISNTGKVFGHNFVNALEQAVKESGVNINDVEEIKSKEQTVRDVIKNIAAEYGINETEAADHIYTILTEAIGEAGTASNVEILEERVTVNYLYDFLEHFADGAANGGQIAFGNGTGAAAADAKLAVDMWDAAAGAYNLKKYDFDNRTFSEELSKLNIANGGLGGARELTYIWAASGEQLQGIQDYYVANSGSNILEYNFALKNDIDASGIANYNPIGTGSDSGFTGKFDGRGNRILGLNTGVAVGGAAESVVHDAGIFSQIGTGGSVSNVNVYSGTFYGTDAAGVIAAVNNGKIDNIYTFGNRIEAGGRTDTTHTDVSDFAVNVGAAGGIAGVNYGTISNITAYSSVIAGEGHDGAAVQAAAGGIAGINAGTIQNNEVNSAVTADDEHTLGVGGIAGFNDVDGKLENNESLGVTIGIYHDDDTNTNIVYSDNIGGIAGINSGTINNAYNESIVNGHSNIGGVAGFNRDTGTINNIVSAMHITGIDVPASGGDDAESKYIGGLVGTNTGSVTNGRNNGTITGTDYVGGLVGNNADKDSTLTNLVNDSSAAILGENYVGGIAGSNAGTITADADNDNLVNRGSITGHMYVGGVAGVNEVDGVIANTVNSVVLNANGSVSGEAQYFGGVVGQNNGLVNGAKNTSDIDITAVGGSIVGGIIGQNTNTGTLQGEILNQGSVSGEANVGGIIGDNENTGVLQGTEDNRLTVTNEGDVNAEDGGAAGIFYQNSGGIQYADITNSGNVTGGTETDSITGGLFGTNSGDIANSTLTNTGVVTGGGTVGGLIGKNTGNAKGSTFTNEGSVEGTENVGGLFGTNSGDFATSSLINTADAQVIGKDNAGGLIGTNTGTITGGRTEADGTTDAGYYKYQIYNNGVISVGTWNDTNKNGIVDTGEIQDLQQGEASANIGGLIGNNTTENGKSGSLTAGYNTGAVNAGGSTNVGGIVGSNAGKVDQVFNTVMVNPADTEQEAAITGGTNVGGLTGANSGTLSNAYNTTDVSGNTNVGNVVGENSGNDAKVEFAYDVTNTDNKLIGENTNGASVDNSYTLAHNEEDADGTNGITYISADESKNKESYKDFTDSTWKFYDGQQTPLLKVFLTDVEIKVDVNKINEYINNIYNGNAQSITDADIDKLIAEGAIKAPDGFKAYNNAKELIESISHTNAGTYSDWLYSGQIASGSLDGSFNPNNLGYDIALAADIDKAKLTVNLGEVTHTYGTPNTNGYNGNYTVIGWVNNEEANDYTISIGSLGNEITDNALKDNNTHTKDAGNNYKWTALNVTITPNGNLSNYKIVTVNAGTSKVTPVTVDVTLNKVTNVYGDSFNSSDYTVNSVGWVNGDSYSNADIALSDIVDHAFTDDKSQTKDVDTYTWVADATGTGANAVTINKNYVFNVVEGQSEITPKKVIVDDILASIEYGSKEGFAINAGSVNGAVYGDKLGFTYDDAAVVVDSEYAVNKGNRDTADVKESAYTDSISLNGIKLTGNKAGNYYVDDSVLGDIKVTPKKITISADDKTTMPGVMPEFTGTDINDMLVNGDAIGGGIYNYWVSSDANINVDGDYTIGIYVNGQYYELNNPDWSNVSGLGFFKNYDVTFTPGTLTVASELLPDTPSDWPHNRWDYLFSDAPFDRNKDFRERKAEVNFVDGGMEI